MLNNIFKKIAVYVSTAAGKPWAFILALSIIIIWATTGPFFNFSNTWQLVINTFTTVITLLMVFLIQNTQNRNSKATQLKLDELLKAIRGARNSLVDLENLPDKEIEQLENEAQEYAKKYSKQFNDNIS